MITLQTTAVCPAGLAAAVALEHLGEVYEVEVVPEGYFLENFGTKGPRLTGATLPSLLGRCVGSAATKHVLEHVMTRVVPKLIAKESPHDELLALDALIDIVPRHDRPKLSPILAPLVRTGRFPEIEQSDAFVRARARIQSESVLAFWFGKPITDEQDAMMRARRWFTGGDAFDAEIRERFLPLVEAAIAGKLDHWATTLRGRRALVIILDQFTRNAFRGTSKMYAGDAKAVALVDETIELPWIERVFFVMPLLHSEDRATLARALEQAKKHPAPAPLERLGSAHVEQSEKYLRVVERFGRFPFRNEALGRESTPEEIAFMETFHRGPGAMRAA